MRLSGQCHATRRFTLGENPRYLLNSWLSGSKHGFGSFEEQKNFLFLLGIEPRILNLLPIT